MATHSNSQAMIVEATVVDHAPPMNAWELACKYCWLVGLLIIVLLSWQAILMVSLLGSRVSLEVASLAVLVLLVVSPIAWLVCFFLFPRPTQYGTLLGLMGLLILAPLPTHLLRSRNSARNNTCSDSLRRLGSEYQQHQVLYDSSRADNLAHWQELVEWSEDRPTDSFDRGWLHEP